jgi:DNA-directed RNA polymerase specialized sigma24 family protein
VVDDTITLEDVDDKRRLVENQELMIPVIDLDRLRQGLTLYETMLFDFRLEGISDKEIAEKLKKNPDAVESALRRVLKKLRKNKNARLQQGQRLDEIIFQCRQPLMNFQE